MPAVLVGRAAIESTECLLAVSVAVLTGMALTVASAFMTSRSAVPALPSSLVLGLVTYFGVKYLSADYIQQLGGAGLTL